MVVSSLLLLLLGQLLATLVGHYGASKAGQLGFMRSAALEYAKYGITVNAVQPGNVLTDGLKAQGEAYLEGTRKIIPT